MKPKHSYVLGTSPEELARLALQHKLWRKIALAAWKKAEFGTGHAILDAGCGPGYATLELSTLVGSDGEIIAVDESEEFLSDLRARLTARKIRNVRVVQEKLEQLHLPPACLDGAYIRWVLCYTSHPAQIIQKIKRSLKTGGRLLIHDYLHYLHVEVSPNHPIFETVFRAVDSSFRQRGGNPNIGLELPGILSKAGFELIEVNPIVRIAMSGSSLWKWSETFFKNYLRRLESMGLIDVQQKNSFQEQWSQRSSMPEAFFVTPPMIEIIATKIK